MAITDKEQGVWGLDQVYNKINEGGIWNYTGEEDEMWAWGDNSYGQLGVNNKTRYSSPVQVSGNWVMWPATTTTRGNAFFSKTGSDLWVTGSGSLLGQNSILNYYSSPVLIPGSWNKVYMSGSAIGSKTDGTLWGWGYNENGELGINNTIQQFSSPIQIGTDTTWTGEVVAGDGVSAAIKTDGSLWTWGSGLRGGTGVNTSIKISSPTQVPGTWANATLQSGGGVATFVSVKSDGTLWMWGNSASGETGNNETGAQYRSSPTQVGTGTDWASAVTGGYNMACTKTNGSLWVWGTNNEGPLGLNQGPGSWTGGAYSSPTQLPGTWSTTQGSIQIGRAFAGIKANGTLWTQGSNIYGELGHDDVVYRSSPTQIPGTDWGGQLQIATWAGQMFAGKP